MKKFNEILKALDISKIKAYYTLIFGDFADLADLLVQALTKLLQKADGATLKKYSELASKIAKFIRCGIELFITDEKYRDAGLKTADAVDALAQHISDGDYTRPELNDDMALINVAVKAWIDIKG